MAPEGDVLGERMAPEGDVLGERMAPDFKGMMREEGIILSFFWYIIILILGAKGVQMYAESRKKKAGVPVQDTPDTDKRA